MCGGGGGGEVVLLTSNESSYLPTNDVIYPQYFPLALFMQLV